MLDHAYYEELAALSAGGHLAAHEHEELREHLAVCPECRESVRAYRDLVISGLPLTRATPPTGSTATPDASLRERFLTRARHDGVRLSPEVEARTVPSRWSLRHSVTAALAVAAALVIAVLSVPQISQRLFTGSNGQELERLRRENAQLSEQLTARDRELAEQQARLRNLQTDLEAAVKTASDLRGNQQGLVRSMSQDARLLDELQNREKQLLSASEEIARINQLRAVDRASLDAQASRLKDVFNQLRVATATIDMERQLAAAGRDMLALMLAKQLRVVDVRDTDASGRPGAAFARVFIAEGRTIRIFAFDLNQGGAGASRRFQVWGESGSGKSLRVLGALDVDDQTQNRWSLSIQNGDVVKDINSVFVTTSARGSAPDGPRLLYARLGP